MLLEAQLEKQSDNQGISEEMEQVHGLDYSKLTETGTTATFCHCIFMYEFSFQRGDINNILV